MTDDRSAPKDDARTAFLFASNQGDRFGVTLDPNGMNLPTRIGENWAFQTQFALGVQDAVPMRIDPEPLVTGIRAQGYYVWENWTRTRT